MGKGCERIHLQGKGRHYSRKLIKVVAIYETVRLILPKSLSEKARGLEKSALLKK